MKKTKVLKTLLATLMLIVLLSTMNLSTVFASEVDAPTANITVNKVEAGATVSIYKLTRVNWNYDQSQPQDPPYAWEPEVSAWIATTDHATYAEPEAFYDALNADATATQAFYSSLVAAMQGGTLTLTPADSKTADGTISYSEVADKTVEFTGCEMGTYLILIDNGYMVYSPLSVNLTPENNGGTWTLNNVSVDAKSTPVQITKTVEDGNYATNDNASYTIMADVPNYVANTTAHTLYISDVLDAGLTFNNDDTFHVYGVNGSSERELTNTADTTYYTLTTTGAKTDKVGTADATFSIDFNYDQVKNFKKIKVVYTAKLNKNNTLVLGTAGNKNTANLVYNNNPYVSTSYKTQTTTEVPVYTYGIKVTKVDKSDTSKKLAGAEFELYNVEQGGRSTNDALYFVGSNGQYYLADSTDAGATTTLVVGTNGELNIYGLDVGTYELKETKAPEGYNLATNTQEITIADSDQDGKLNDAKDNTGIVSIEFKNTKGFTLPVTGGTGIVIFAVAGILLIAVGATVIVVNRKRQSK